MSACLGSAVHKTPARAYQSFLLSARRISRSSPPPCLPACPPGTLLSPAVTSVNVIVPLTFATAPPPPPEQRPREREGEMAWDLGVGGRRRRRRSCAEDKGQAANARVVWTPALASFRILCFQYWSEFPRRQDTDECRQKAFEIEQNGQETHLKRHKSPRTAKLLGSNLKQNEVITEEILG